MGTATVIVLRLLHVVMGVFWAGTVLFMARFLLPSIRAAGPAGGAVMQQLVQIRKVPIVLMTAAILTVLSGITLYWHDSGGFQGVWMASGSGRMFGLGGLFGLIAVIVGMAGNAPVGKRMGEVMAAIAKAGGPPSPEQVAELKRLQDRLYKLTQAVAGLVFLAVIAMAVARYVP
ncbi:MAG: hypothetical protein ABI679_06445 [Gemmatimonadota bacterium]